MAWQLAMDDKKIISHRDHREHKVYKIIKYFFSVSPVCPVREIYSAMHNIMAMEKRAKRLTVNREPDNLNSNHLLLIKCIGISIPLKREN